ncbi:NUMOD1 domain-containing DNA-binding protein [Robiginitalea sp. SC105]|uniref:NUMOD1 domain-containing DNA-binding protein n=1 Tax=Robiginitalea sp. SC105 TaxID=2762332 RepID=UPI00163A01CC|nr:NUMOD1 domain-containing DNA-binding protein [Robiginitalea sp. SC105]MBC2840106.1 GIY-YIG nuclease family protein [Robiginitalea sp. SC105]
MSQINGILYKAMNRITGEVYIGATTSTLEARKQDHLQKASQGKGGIFQEAIGTYGPDAFTWEVIDSSGNLDELAEKERYYIEHYDSQKKGYNRDQGGGFAKTIYQYCPETGRPLGNFKSLEEAAKAVGSCTRTISNACLGYNRSCSGYFWSYSEYTSYPISSDQRKKSVIQLTMEGLLVASHRSVAEASRATGLSKTCIARACRGERDHSGGYRWYYIK